MVDTLFLTTSEFGISKKNKLSSKVYFNPEGMVVSDTKLCNLSQTGEGNASFTIHSRFGAPICYCNVSLPKMLYGTSLKEVNQSDFDRCVEGIHNQFTKAGIEVDKYAIPGMKVGRIDYCKNIKVDGLALDYTELFMQGYMPGRFIPDHTPPGTALWRNRNRQFTCYDKIGEVLNDTKQRFAAGLSLDTPHTVLRCESRLLNGGAVKRTLEVRAFQDCYSMELARKHLLQDFDKLQVDSDIMNAFNNSELSYLLMHYNHDKVVRYLGKRFILAEVNGDIDRLKALLLLRYPKEPGKKNKGRQVRNQLRQYRNLASELQTPRQRDMLAEVRRKLAA